MGTRRGTSTGLRVFVLALHPADDERSSLPLFCSIDLVADRGRTAFANQKQKGCSPSLMKLVATQRMAGGDWRGSARARVHGGTSLHRSRGVGTSRGPQGEAWDVQQPLPPSKRRRTTRASFLFRNGSRLRAVAKQRRVPLREPRTKPVEDVREVRGEASADSVVGPPKSTDAVGFGAGVVLTHDWTGDSTYDMLGTTGRMTTSTSPLTQERIQAIAQKLRERKAQLEAELKAFASRNPHVIGDWQTQYANVGRSEDENAAEVTMYSDNLPLERTLEKELRDVTNALSRIEGGTYGTCRYCSKQIDEKRLLARPTSSACIACKVERKNAAA